MFGDLAPVRITLNPGLVPGAYDDVQRSVLSAAEAASADDAVRSWSGYAPTSLQSLPGIADRLGVATVQVKLEGERFHIGSFKALGPPYALEREIARRGRLSEAGRFTAIAATSGNHGRALAWGAARLGAGCTIFMPDHTSQHREQAIRGFGAEVIRVPGDFDDALSAAAAEAKRPHHILVSDMPFEGRVEIARDTLAGYSVLARELLDQCAGAMPTHVFVSAGNGTLAAAICGRLWLALGAARPVVCTVEPNASDALRRSLGHRRREVVTGGTSVMDGLVVRSPSAVAWPILSSGIHAGIAISDDAAITTLRGLAGGLWGDTPIEVGETGIAALAGLIAVAGDPDARRQLGIGSRSRLFALLCEGVTDREVFERLVSRDPI